MNAVLPIIPSSLVPRQVTNEGKPVADGPQGGVGGGRPDLRGRERRIVPKESLDFFRTPAWATEALLEREVFPGRVWECAAGDGAMAVPIASAGYDVFASDLVQRGFGAAGVDFLRQERLPDGVQSIVTNPPFNRGIEFALHALQLGARKVALIQRLAFLEGKERESKLFSVHPPARIWVFARRVTMWRGDDPDARDSGGAMAFAWFVFERGHRGTQLGWIP